MSAYNNAAPGWHPGHGAKNSIHDADFIRPEPRGHTFGEAAPARHVALLANTRSPVESCEPRTFNELAALLAMPEIGTKDGPAWMPAQIDPGSRTAARVQSVSFLTLDVEAEAGAVRDAEGKARTDAHGDPVKLVTGAEPPMVDAMLEELKLRGWRCHLHTSYSHGGAILPEGVEHPRYRLIFDLSRSLNPDELRPLGHHVAALLGLADCADLACLEPARLFYLPRVPSEERRALFRFATVPGKALAVDELLADARREASAAQTAVQVQKSNDKRAGSVIAAFNDAHDVGAMLERSGYTALGRARWLWPGSTTGLPGVRLLPGSGPARVYSSHGGDPLADGHAHDAFDLFRILEHRGDVHAAVRAAADLLGIAREPGAAARTNGGDPEPFEAESPPTPWPADALPPGMAEAAQALADHLQVPLALAGFAVLGAVAHVAQRLADAEHPKTGAMPCSLFLLTSADSGDRKSSCYTNATRPIEQRERKVREEHKRECARIKADTAKAKGKGKARDAEPQPPDPRTIYTDATMQKIEQAFIDGSAPALSLSTDEGGTLFSGYSLKVETRAASMGNLTRLFDGRGAQRDRIGVNGMDTSGFRFGVRFSLFLSAQPVVLASALADPVMRGQGLLPRFLYCAPASPAGTRFEDRESLRRRIGDDARMVAFWRALADMDTAHVQVDEHGSLALNAIAMDEAATGEWLKLYNDTEAEQGPGGELHGLKAFAARSGELAARVAAIHTVWRRYFKRVGAATTSADDMRRAAALVRYSLAEWGRHSEAVTLAPHEHDARDLLSWLQEKGWDSFTRSKLATHGPGWLRKSTVRRAAAIAELTRRRWLTEKASTYMLAHNPIALLANAKSANSANSAGGDANEAGAPADAVSTISRISISSPPDGIRSNDPAPGPAAEEFEL